MTIDPVRRAAVTYRYDLRQAFFLGMCESSWVTFGLLIAIRGFDADNNSSALLDLIKGLIPAAGSLGMLLGPFALMLAARSGRPASRMIAMYIGIAGVLVLGATQAHSLIPFAVLWIVANIIYAQQVGLMTQIYAWNYVTSNRGKRLATTFIVGASGGLIFSLLWGRLLDWNFGLFPLLIGSVAVACFCGAYFINKIPSEPFQRSGSGNAFRHYSLIWQDKLFGLMLLSWMFIGIGNMMTIPIRIEYMANPDYQINATNEQVALAAVIIPFAVRFVSARFWGILFDRINFITWRIAINICFVTGTAMFFFSHSLPMLYVGSAFFGMAMGGGAIAWNLWVTKIAPPSRVSQYMSVHTSLTGIRGVLSPFLGYWLISYSPALAGAVAIGFIVLASALFCTEYNNPRFNEKF